MDRQELEKRLEWYSKKYGSYIEKRGLHNWRNLFVKPTILEWTILAMLILSLFMAYAYNHDMKACQDNCNSRIINFCSPIINYSSDLTNFILTEETINNTEKESDNQT